MHKAEKAKNPVYKCGKFWTVATLRKSRPPAKII